MKTEMTVNGVSVCPTAEERHEYFTLTLSHAERNGSANTTTAMRTKNCSPASPRHWKNAEQNGIHG